MRIKKVYLFIIVALILGLMSAPALADQDITLKCSLNYIPLPYCYHTPDGTVSVTTYGQETLYPIINGGFTVPLTVPSSGETTLTVMSDYTPTKSFYFSLDSSGAIVLLGPVRETMTLFPRSDGAYFFDFAVGTAILISDQTAEGAPVLGATLNRYWDPVPGPIQWGAAEYWSGAEVTRMWHWGPCEAFGLLMTRRDPNGQLSSAFYPLEWSTVETDGTEVYTTNDQFSGQGWTWRIFWRYSAEFVRSLAQGTHWVYYWLVGHTGVLSNVRVDQIIVSFD